MSEEKEAACAKDPAAPLYAEHEDLSSCHLDEEGFLACCQLLLQHSLSIRDGWVLESSSDLGDAYLRKTSLRSVAFLKPEPGVASEEPDPDLLTPDPLTLEEDPQIELDQVLEVPWDDVRTEVVQYEYHIVYSCSYQTPVLYFRASTLDGRSLSLVEVWKNVHPNYSIRLRHSPWNSITQQEHPVLGQPFFMLHPCRTEEFMLPVMKAAQEQHRQVNYIVTWLSVVGPVIGLEVPLSYSTQVPGRPSPS